MILEVVNIKIDPDRHADYLKAFAEARPLVARQPGCKSVRLLPQLTREGSFLLLIEWDRLEDHQEGFRKSDDYRLWSELLHPFYDPFPEVNYFESS